MKFPYRCDITRAAHKGSTRGSLDRIQVKRINGKDMAIATDGVMAAFVPVKMETGDVPGLFVAAAFDAARRQVEIEREESDAPTFAAMPDAEVTLHPSGAATVVDTVFRSDRNMDHRPKFPNVAKVIPDGKPKVSVTIDAKKLLELAKAIGAECGDMAGVTIEIRGKDEAVVVRASNPTTDAFGVLMPMLAACEVKE